MYKHFSVIKLANRATVDGILVFILYAKSLGIFAFVVFEFVIVKGCRHVIVDGILGFAEVNGSAHVADLFDRHTAREKLGKARGSVSILKLFTTRSSSAKAIPPSRTVAPRRAKAPSASGRE